MIDNEYVELSAGKFSDDIGKEKKDHASLLDVVLVRMDRSRRSEWYQTGDLRLAINDSVVVEADRGTAVGIIRSTPKTGWFKDKDKPPRVVRHFRLDPATDKDFIREREHEFIVECLALAKEKGLELDVVDAEYLHWENRVVFYFVSEGRVDFRELVRDLSRSIRSRVEMRQIGPRDETRLLGGIGTCGREFCCSTFLNHFESIRIRMVKDQGLVLNPQKVSGGCGKLKCCLAYEVEVYRRLRKDLPSLGTKVMLPDDQYGVIGEIDLIGQRVRVICESGERMPRSFKVMELRDAEGTPFVPEEYGKRKDDAEMEAYFLETSGKANNDSGSAGKRGSQQRNDNRGRNRQRAETKGAAPKPRPDKRRNSKNKSKDERRKSPDAKKTSQQGGVPVEKKENKRPRRRGGRRPNQTENRKPKEN